jgi:hypothetical protein
VEEPLVAGGLTAACTSAASAQLWLRDTTNSEKAEYFKRYTPALSGTTRMPEGVAVDFFSEVMSRDLAVSNRERVWGSFGSMESVPSRTGPESRASFQSVESSLPDQIRRDAPKPTNPYASV